jgi:hypothetical protein
MTHPIDLRAEKVSRENDNRKIQPQDALILALADLESGAETPNRVMVLFWDDGEEEFDTNFYACNINSSEMLALLEMTKQRILRDMGLT